MPSKKTREFQEPEQETLLTVPVQLSRVQFPELLLLSHLKLTLLTPTPVSVTVEVTATLPVTSALFDGFVIEMVGS